MNTDHANKELNPIIENREPRTVDSLGDNVSKRPGNLENQLDTQSLYLPGQETIRVTKSPTPTIKSSSCGIASSYCRDEGS
jgi:hypothetical protein